MQEQIMEKNERQSNIELLRIIIMIGVVVLHYNNPEIGGGLRYTCCILLFGVHKNPGGGSGASGIYDGAPGGARF